MRQPILREESERRKPIRLWLAVAITALIHLGLFTLFQSYNPEAFEIDIDPISVELVALSPAQPQPEPTSEPSPVTIAPAPPPTETQPEPPLELPPEPLAPEPETEITPLPPIPTPPAPDILPPEEQSSLPVQVAPSPEGDVLIPDRWRLPVGARISLGEIGPAKGSLGEALDCLKSFNTDCSEQRKAVFAEDQLSETDLVWMASHPHSGLSDSSLHGLSEAEIRDRLGIPSAGENGLAILPGIAIDGPLWDILHGVNKACDYSVGIGANGQKELQKRCPDQRPSSRDRIAFKPKIE